MNILWNYPAWLWLILVLVSAGASAVLYFRNKDVSEIPKPFRIAAALLRFFSVLLLLLMIFSPLFRTLSREKENPVILFIQDNSESIRFNKDSTFYQNDYPLRVNRLREELSKNFETVFYTTGENLQRDGTLTLNEKLTDYESAFRELESVYAGRNVGAVVFAGDGLFNKGIHPVYRIKNLKAPVYSIALGDSALQRDAYIRKVNVNRIAYLNNAFPVEINIGADRLKGKNLQIKISEGSKVLFSQSISADDELYDKTIPVLLNADKPGIRKYTVTLTSDTQEYTLRNNSYPFYVEIVDGRRKVLLLADGPHPDLGALMQAYSLNENFEAELSFLNDFSGKPENYSLVVLYQIPGQSAQAAELTARLKKSGISTWYILGSRSNLFAFNQLNEGLKITNSGAKPDESVAAVNPGFGAFTLSDKLKTWLPQAPPLFTPFGNYETKAGTETVLFRKIGLTVSNTPALLLQAEPSRRTAVLAGEGIWRWGLDDFEKNGNREQFNELISKITQYLSLTEDKSKFRVNAKNRYSETESVLVDAELYNDNLEPVNTPEANLAITNADGKSFPFTFSRTENAYRADCGKLPPGDYRFKAETVFNGKKLEKTGAFTISEMQAEFMNTRADFGVMSRLADETDGELYTPATMDEIPERLKARDDVKPITFSTGKLTGLSDLKWLFFIFLLMLAGEWFIRKYFGRY